MRTGLPPVDVASNAGTLGDLYAGGGQLRLLEEALAKQPRWFANPAVLAGLRLIEVRGPPGPQ